MTTVSRSFTVTPPPSVVVPYLADFGHAEEWDPGTESCTRTDSGPVAVGAQWLNKTKLLGVSTELTYTLTELTDSRVVLVGTNDTATATENMEVTPEGTGSRVTYVNELEMHGAAKLAAPAMKLLFEKLANDVEKRLTEALNRQTG
jgi:carbon monoxide dehydrogenase subunit G